MKKSKSNASLRIIITVVLIIAITLITVNCNFIPSEPKPGIAEKKINTEKDSTQKKEQFPGVEEQNSNISDDGSIKSENEEKINNDVENNSSFLEYENAFGIDYRNPEKYLIQGEQSKISDLSRLETLYSNEKGLAQLKNTYFWIKDNFKSYSAGGKTIGKITADDLLEDLSLGGCHDYALIYSAITRELGYPSVMVRSSSIAWIKQFKADGEDARPRVGHVFVEVYLDDRWILIDSTNGWYLEKGYNPANAVIPLKGNIAGQTEEIYGFYVEKKGYDIWDMGIHDQTESGISMDEHARRLYIDSILYPDYSFERFSK